MEESLHTTTEVHVGGTDRFRAVVLFGSLIAGLASLLLVLLDPRDCDVIKMRYAVYMLFGAHIFTFLLLLASYLCQACVRALGRVMIICYFLLVGTMVGVQVIFFHGAECNRVAPALYYWLFVNIACFYVLIAYGLSLWGAYICWEVDEEEKLI